MRSRFPTVLASAQTNKAKLIRQEQGGNGEKKGLIQDNIAGPSHIAACVFWDQDILVILVRKSDWLIFTDIFSFQLFHQLPAKEKVGRE